MRHANRSATVRALTWIAFAGCIFWLPYHVPSPFKVYSFSATVGFNNSVAVLSVVIGLMVLTLEALSSKQPGPRQPIESDAGPPLTHRPLIAFAIIQALSNVSLFLLTNGRSFLGEGDYFISRLNNLELGLTPYRDFEFAYGPALLYIPQALHRFLPLSIRSAYFVSLSLFQIVGLYLLWDLIQHSSATPRAKTYTFYCLGVPFILMGVALGLQYTPLRFLAPYFGLLVLKKLTGPAVGRPVFFLFLCTLLIALMFAISPEVGAAFIPSLFTFLITKACSRSRNMLSVALGLILVLLVLVPLLPSSVLASVRTYSAGGYNSPVVPTLFVLLYLYSLASVVPRLGLAVVSGVRNKCETALPYDPALTAAFAVQTIAMVPGALGRANGGHVFCYGIGAFLLFMLSTSLRKPWGKLYIGAFATVFILLVPLIGCFVYLRGLASDARGPVIHWAERHPTSPLVNLLEGAMGRERWGRQVVKQERADARGDIYRRVAGYGVVCVPLGGLEYTEPLAVHHALRPDYFDGLKNVYQVQRKIAGLKDCQYIVVPPEALKIGGGYTGEDMKSFKWEYLFPFNLEIKKDSSEVFMPIYAYLRSRYCLVERLNAEVGLYHQCALGESIAAAVEGAASMSRMK